MKTLFLKLSLLLILCFPNSTAKPLGVSYSRNIPDLAHQKLSEYQKAGKRIDVLAFTKEDEWILIAENYRYYSSRSYFDQLKIRPKIEEYLAAGRTIDTVAFNERNEWILFSGDYRFYQGVRTFNQSGLRPKLEELRSQRKRIHSIAFGPNDSWVVVSKNGEVHSSSTLRTALPDLWYLLVDFKSTSKQPVQEINIMKVNGRYRWVVVADNCFWSANWTVKGRNTMTVYRRSGKDVNRVALSPGGGWSIVSNNLFQPERRNQKANRFERDLRFTLNGSIKASHILDRMAFHKIPGVSLVLIKNGRVVLARGYGLEQAGTDKHVMANRTLFPAASWSKSIASAGFLSLTINNNKIGLNSTLGTVVSNYNFTTLPRIAFMKWYNLNKPQSSQATFRQLLTHTAGLNTHGIGLDPLGRVGGTAAVLVNSSNRAKVKFIHQPGQFWDYSGGGYTVAEALLEAITRKQFGVYMKERVLNNLNMPKSRFTTPTGAFYAIGHNVQLQPLSRGDCPGEAAGGLITTPTEFSHFILALMNNGIYGNKRVLPANLISEFFNGTSLTNFDSTNNPKSPRVYSLGLNLNQSNNPSSFNHGGSQAGYRNFFRGNLGTKDAILIMTNGTASWVDSNGRAQGANTLISEIENSFNRNY